MSASPTDFKCGKAAWKAALRHKKVAVRRHIHFSLFSLISYLRRKPHNHSEALNEKLPPQRFSHRLASSDNNQQHPNRHTAYQRVKRPEHKPHLKGYPQKHLDKHGVPAHGYHRSAGDEESACADGFKSGLAASRKATAMRFARYVVNGDSTSFLFSLLSLICGGNRTVIPKH